MSPSRTGFWLDSSGRKYWVEVDQARTLLSAAVEVTPHDKPRALRTLKHPVTLARLQALVRPAARCEHCGAERDRT